MFVIQRFDKLCVINSLPELVTIRKPFQQRFLYMLTEHLSHFLLLKYNPQALWNHSVLFPPKILLSHSQSISKIFQFILISFYIRCRRRLKLKQQELKSCFRSDVLAHLAL